MLNIFSKKFLNITKMSPMYLLSLLSQYSLIFFFPIWFFFDFIQFYETLIEKRITSWVFVYLIFDGFLCFAQNLIAFILISKVSPLTYSIANVTKRISVIILSIIAFRNAITFTNIFGINLAIFGLFAYNKFKYDERIEKEKQTQLPLHHNTVIVNNHQNNKVTFY
ncbi:hypothetical protein B4U80_06200 [Leptotrombidium deliense]|uniref:Sugar phosphate transporter domain-containing protein n=1 Tax=Leptotrombidium deliense TaxID=299467 RepID=A0A443SKI6_9ACAR|nr:hypothetical protein B4U80_06200 [Leptotrombidium deliense]